MNTLEHFNFTANASLLVDMRLEATDGGWYTPARVKDANGWRDADYYEQHAIGVATPVWGYDKHSNGKYTESGLYEVCESYGATKHSSSHANRKEARAAMMQYLNDNRRTDAARMFLETFSGLLGCLTIETDFSDLYTGNGPTFTTEEAAHLQQLLTEAVAALGAEEAAAVIDEGLATRRGY